MATYVFNVLKDYLANATIDLADARIDGSTIADGTDTSHAPIANAVFRACLIQPSSSLIAADTNNGGTDAVDLTLCSDITTLNELDRTGYTPMTTGAEADNDWVTATLTKVTGPSGYTKWVVADLTITTVIAGQDVNGILVVWDKDDTSTNLNTKVPLVWIGLAGDISTNGGNITINWASTGLVQIA